MKKGESPVWISTFGAAFAQITLYNMMSSISETHKQIADRAKLIADGADEGRKQIKRVGLFGG